MTKTLPCIYASEGFAMSNKDAVLKALIVERDNLTEYSMIALASIDAWLGFDAPDFYRSVG